MFHKLFVYIFLGTLSAMLMACSPHSVREAQLVVADADSLWHNGQLYGIDYGDSATLAQAYAALNTPLSTLTPHLSSSYAHACYHYGRLLREKENPVAAMECFIHATHSHTRDYHILGRVYSNMGSTCHLASEFPLSYDMYERSTNYFLQDGDTLLFYYGLYNMAFELAALNKKDSCFALLDSITHCTIKDDYLDGCCFLTKAKAYLMNRQNDSAIYYAKLIPKSCDADLSGALIIAQAYDNLGKNDSALVYANKVLGDSSSPYQNKFNALFIVRNNDSSLCAKDIRELASQREDIRYYEYEPEKMQLSQAVQFLTQDINRKPDLTWLYVLIATIIVISCFISVYVTLKRKKHKLLSQKVEDLTKAASIIQEKHDELSESYQTHRKRLEKELETNCRLLTSNHKMLKELVGGKYDEMCNIIDRDFHMLASKLRNLQTLTEPEVCLCILVFLGLTRQQIADLLHYANSGIGKFKYRVSLKLGIESKNLRNFLINMALDEPRK